MSGRETKPITPDEAGRLKSETKVIDLYFTPCEVSEERLKAYKTVVVVDVLRVGTTIPIALSNGAREVFPVTSIAVATSLAAQLGRDDILLCGEREGRLIDGFHIGNSPSDYTRERVRGRTLIFATTNGTPALVKAAGAPKVYLCGFINLPAVLGMMLNIDNQFPLAVLCAGKFNRFALEDAVCGGMLTKQIQERTDGQYEFNDGARSALMIAREFGNDIYTLLKNCDHGRYLIQIGMEDDLPRCAAQGVLPVAPVMKDGKLVKAE